jgi:diketogulonate reductase-like aldo/keto reductase
MLIVTRITLLFTQWAKEHDLLLEAYSPLGGSGEVGETLSQPVVKSIAQDLGITPAQVIISWHVQRGVRL